MKLPLSNESVKMPDDVLEALKQVLKNFKGVGKSDMRISQNFKKVLEKNADLLAEHIPIQ